MARLIILLLIHIVGDYFLQGNKVNELKATKLSYMWEHIGIYTVLFIVLSPLLLGLTLAQGVAFSLINGAFHFVVDYYAARYKMKFNELDDPRYVVTIGLNQFANVIFLYLTYLLLFPEALMAGYLFE